MSSYIVRITPARWRKLRPGRVVQLWTDDSPRWNGELVTTDGGEFTIRDGPATISVPFAKVQYVYARRER